MPKPSLTGIDKSSANKGEKIVGRYTVTEKALIAALRKHGGIQALAAKELKTSRQNVHQRIQTSERIRTAIAEIEEETLDIGEGHLIKALRKGDKEIVKYYLDRKGKRRGYGNRGDFEAKLSEETLMAIVMAMGGDLDKLKAARAAVSSSGPQ